MRLEKTGGKKTYRDIFQKERKGGAVGWEACNAKRIFFRKV